MWKWVWFAWVWFVWVLCVCVCLVRLRGVCMVSVATGPTHSGPECGSPENPSCESLLTVPASPQAAIDSPVWRTSWRIGHVSIPRRVGEIVSAPTMRGCELRWWMCWSTTRSVRPMSDDGQQACTFTVLLGIQHEGLSTEPAQSPTRAWVDREVDELSSVHSDSGWGEMEELIGENAVVWGLLPVMGRGCQPDVHCWLDPEARTVSAQWHMKRRTKFTSVIGTSPPARWQCSASDGNTHGGNCVARQPERRPCGTGQARRTFEACS